MNYFFFSFGRTLWSIWSENGIISRSRFWTFCRYTFLLGLESTREDNIANVVNANVETIVASLPWRTCTWTPRATLSILKVISSMGEKVVSCRFGEQHLDTQTTVRKFDGVEGSLADRHGGVNFKWILREWIARRDPAAYKRPSSRWRFFM